MGQFGVGSRSRALSFRSRRELKIPISRARALLALTVLSGTMALGVLAGDRERAAARQSSARPNIILIVTDDQTDAQLRPDVMPNVTELLAGHGTTFTHAVTTTPLCCPSRASILTGQYAHNHRVLFNRYRLLVQKRNTLPVWLDRAGYRTIHIGKYLNNYEEFASPISKPAPGWDDWHAALGRRRYWNYDLQVNGRTEHFGSRDADYLTRVLNDRAASLVRRLGKLKRPFYMQLDQFAPHPGGPRTTCDGRSPQPDPRDRELFGDEPLPAVPSLNEEDVSDKPSFIRHSRTLSKHNLAKIRRRWRCGLASLKAVDDGVAELHRALEDIGELDHTVIIFTSDNGSYFGEHRIPDQKHLPYMEGISIPLIIRSPLRALGRDPRIGVPVASMDLAPTILDLAKATPCQSRNDCRVMDGRSLVPLLKGKAKKRGRKRALVLELRMPRADSTDGRSCRYRGILVPGAVYVKHTGVAPVGTRNCRRANEREYYDLDADPFQLQNLHRGRSDETRQERRLAKRLRRLRDCSGIKGRDPRDKGRAHCQ
jgi:N-acetylglucosamine-6-sulfatase